MSKLKLINESEYDSDCVSETLFEDEHSRSFAKLELKNTTIKFGWNSKGVEPQVNVREGFSLAFVGIDTYVVGYNYRKRRVVFYLNTSTNFKWFDDITTGIAIVTETGIILINVADRCTLRNCIFFGDLIVDTKVENGKMRIGFLSNDVEIINV